MGRLSQRQVSRICESFNDPDEPWAKLARAKLRAWTDTATVDKDRLKPAEQLCMGHMLAQGCTIYRNGWPDFLIDTDDGRTIAVEVKAPTDQVRPAQRRMFAALERLGIPVFVWDPRKPDALTPWSGFRKEAEPTRNRYGANAA
jgi:hypothetical protein